MSTNWQLCAQNLIFAKSGGDAALKAFLDANLDSVRQVIEGIDPGGADPGAGAGARMVVNISCKHVPAFCELSKNGDPKPYKNAYDLNRVQPERQWVDSLIRAVTGIKPKDLYFAAAEISGTGIRFYGDMTLVLKRATDPATGEDAWNAVSLLDRDSFDLLFEPLRSKIEAEVHRSGRPYEDVAADELRNLSGTWGGDLPDMAWGKVLPSLPVGERRWTTGQIAGHVLEDEDYLEVLRAASFGAADLHEVRLSASDAAAEADIADREANGEAPSIHELEWRQQRREAKRALAALHVPVRVVTTAGRVKGG